MTSKCELIVEEASRNIYIYIFLYGCLCISTGIQIWESSIVPNRMTVHILKGFGSRRNLNNFRHIDTCVCLCVFEGVCMYATLDQTRSNMGEQLISHAASAHYPSLLFRESYPYPLLLPDVVFLAQTYMSIRVNRINIDCSLQFCNIEQSLVLYFH